MKKINYVLVLITCLLVLTSCKGTNAPPESTFNKNTPVTSPEMYSYSKQMSDAALSYYLGGEYEDAFVEPLIGLPRLVSPSREIHLDKQAVILTSEYILVGSKYALDLVEFKTLEGESREDFFGRYDKEITDNLDKYIFPDEEVPEMRKLDSDLRPTSEFREWFIQRAKETGLLDKRINYTYPDVLSVSSQECSPSKGGTDFKIFGTIYSVSRDDVGVTMDEVKDSHLYDLEEKSYRFYDSGYYEATYETKASSATNEKIAVTITFKYTAPNTGDYQDARAKFIAGVSDLEINTQGVK